MDDTIRSMLIKAKQTIDDKLANSIRDSYDNQDAVARVKDAAAILAKYAQSIELIAQAIDGN